jgi:dTDP-4-dehydrorhamnose 3,5-epimerase
MNIEGVVVKKLSVIADERGYLMEIMRNDEKIFSEYGQHYLTTCYANVVKAWHWHKFQDDNFCVIKGMARIGLYDGRVGSPTHGQVMDLVIGKNNPCLVHIPRGVYHGFKAVGGKVCYLLNMVTKAYNRDEPDEHRVKWNTKDIPFEWKKEIDG